MSWLTLTKPSAPIRFKSNEEKLKYALSKALDDDLSEAPNTDPYSYITSLRAYDILVESIDLVHKTRYPRTFFGRYDDILFFSKMILDRDAPWEYRQLADRSYGEYTVNQTEYTNRFLDRCREDYLHEVLKYKDKMTIESYDYLRTKLRALND